ncbi:amidohydrolase family protein, partial [Bacteroidota bacterium]
IMAFQSCDRDWNDQGTHKGNLLIRNVSIVDPVNEKIKPGMDILIRDGMIADVSITGEIAVSHAEQIIEGEDFYAMAGFVNSHTHLWQHLSRSVSPSEQLQQWIPKVYKPAYHLSDEEFYEINLTACYDALLHGITSVLDWTVNGDEGKIGQVLSAMDDSGLGGAIAWPHTAVFLPFETEKREFERIRSRARQTGRDLFVAHLPPERIPIPLLYDGILLGKTVGAPIAEHIMENVQCQRDWLTKVKSYLENHGARLDPSDRVYLEQIASKDEPPSIDAITAMALNARTLLSIINSRPDESSAYEAEDIIYLEQLASHTGPSYIPFLEHLGAYEHGYVSVHSSLLGPDDIDIYRKHDVVINHNPESNAYLASGIAPISNYLIEGLTVSLGTDGAASNDRIDMLAAMRLMSHMQKLTALNIPLPGDLDSWGLLRAATIAGAKALGQEERIGSIEPGKEADIILFDAGSFELHPVTEHPSCIADLIVNSAESRDIHTVIANGRIKVSGNKLLGLNEAKMAKKVTSIRNAAMVRTDWQAPGRIWSEEITISDADKPQVRYRSIYPNYEIEVKVKNESGQVMELALVISDAEKAGGYFYARQTWDRFPANPYNPEKVKETVLELLPGESITLIKKAEGNPMQFFITDPSGRIDQFNIDLPDDPLWAWTLRANVYLETGVELDPIPQL